MTVTFNSSLKWILLTMLNRCIAEIISALKKNGVALIAALWSEGIVWVKWRQICYWTCLHWSDQSCFPSAANQETSRCRRIQMSDEVMSLSRCSHPAVPPSILFISASPFLYFFLLDPSSFNLSVCPSVPETLNLWGQSRSQVRSSGTGLHSVSTAYD